MPNPGPHGHRHGADPKGATTGAPPPQDRSPGGPGREAYGPSSPDTLEVRPLRTLDEYRACVALQRATWGEAFSEIVPLALLKVGQRIGGVTAGAFDASGALLGFVFGLTGVGPDGRLVHWSDMLAVRSDLRDQGIGRRLKEYQRDALRARGVEVMYWTYDPLVARNAHLNLARLGARVIEYEADMYGSTDSPLHQGLGTDRFVVAWTLDTPAPSPDGIIHGAEKAPVMNPRSPGGDVDLGAACARAPVVRVLIPPDIQAVQARSLAEAAEWRRDTREAFGELLARGYRVGGFQHDPAAGSYGYLFTLSPNGGTSP